MIVEGSAPPRRYDIVNATAAAKVAAIAMMNSIRTVIYLNLAGC